MYRARLREENPSRRTADRGSVGSARVWDERTRAVQGAPNGTPNGAPNGTPNGAHNGTHNGHNGNGSALPTIPPAELESVVATLVHAALEALLARTDPDSRLQLARSLQERVLGLLGGIPENGITNGVPFSGILVEPPPTPAESEAPEDDLPTGNGEPDTTPDGENGANGDGANRVDFLLLDPGVRALGLVLDDRLSRLGGPLAQRDDVRERLITLVLGTLQPRDDQPAASRTELMSLDTLQRRLVKLERSLEETRAALDYVSRLEHFDEGIASIYRFVQGLAPDDPQRERKQESLEGIFQANLALQKPARPPRDA